MSKKLYVGNLSFTATSDDLSGLFGEYGTVTSASVVTDRETGRSRGFGFVEMSDGADAAIAGHQHGLVPGPEPDRERGEAARGSSADSVGYGSSRKY